MTSHPLFRTDAYLREAPGRVVGLTPEGGVVLDRCLFYPTGGGQPGDGGHLTWDGGHLPIETAIKGEAGSIVLVPAGPAVLPAIGQPVVQQLDWVRRFAHMRVHTALHLLSVVIPRPVTGGAIGPGRGRLDFDMPDPPADMAAVTAALNDLIARDLAVTEDWITEAELDANPGLVKTLSVSPPRGSGSIRLVRISDGTGTVDLQPCGGTHVARTGQIGPVALGRIENKGRQNRRVPLELV